MKIGYILMFVFISMFGCCACIYCCSLGERRRQHAYTSDTGNLNAYLIPNEGGCGSSSQPVVVVQSAYHDRQGQEQGQEEEVIPIAVVASQPVVFSKTADDQF
jgi:hypothetical protein